MSSPVVAAPFDFKSFIPQPPSGADGAALAERIQAIIKAFSEDGKDLPTPPTEAEREAIVEKVKGILANLHSENASGAPSGFTFPQVPAGIDGEAIREKVQAILANLKAEGKDLPTPPAGLPAGFKIPQQPTGVSAIPQTPAGVDVEVIIERVKSIVAGFEAEGKSLPTPPTGLPAGFTIPTPPTNFAIPQASSELSAPQVPEGVNVDAIVEKVKAILAGYAAEGKSIPTPPTGLPEGFKIPSPPTGLKAPQAPAGLPEGFSIPSPPEGFTIPQLPSGPEGEAIMAKVKDTLQTLGEDASFKDLSIMEKVKAVIKHFDEEK